MNQEKIVDALIRREAGLTNSPSDETLLGLARLPRKEFLIELRTLLGLARTTAFWAGAEAASEETQ